MKDRERFKEEVGKGENDGQTGEGKRVKDRERFKEEVGKGENDGQTGGREESEGQREVQRRGRERRQKCAEREGVGVQNDW